MSYGSLREFILFLESKGQLKRIREPIAAELELTEVADRVVKAGGPALLFENVTYRPIGEQESRPSPFPIAMNLYGSWQRMGWSLGVEDVETVAHEIDAMLKTQPPGSFFEKLKMLPKLAQFAASTPKSVARGPCQEVVMENPDLRRLPIPTCWPLDGGPYITFANTITKDPDSGIRNVGLYRLQILGPREAAMHWQIHKVGARHFSRAKELGQKIEVAISLGGDPILAYAASAPLPDGVDEYLFAGLIRKKGIEMVRGQTISLEVPASADIVIEGYVDPNEPLVKEGPFGDHTGYYSLADDYPRLHVTAITHRRDAIFPHTIVGVPPMEDAFIGKASERIFLPMIRMNFPEIIDMHLPVEGAFHNLAIVSIKKQYPGHARKIMHSLWGTGQLMFTKCALIVDHDVNVQNLKEVTWQVCANLDPRRDMIFSEGPSDSLDHASPTLNFGSKLGIDATRKWPGEAGAREWPPVIQMSAQVKQRIDSLWTKLGLKG